jgi:hypothetical protein
MMVPPKERGQVLIILAASWLLFGGGASSALVVYERPVSEIKKAVKRVIPPGERRDAIISQLRQWESVHKQQDERVSSDREEVLELLRRRQTQRSELEPILAKLDKTLLVMDWDFLNVRFRVKDQVTSAEWAAMVGQPDR